jgi:glyoxylate reductase
MKKVLVTMPLTGQGMDALKGRFNVTHPDKGRYTRDELLEIIHEFDGILATGIGMDAELIRAAGNLKIISVYGAGYDSIDVDEASRQNILVANAPESVTESTAELAFGLMLATARNIAARDRWLRINPGSRWGMMMNEGQSLYGKTLGIVGLGRIGKAVARRGLASGMKVFYFNRNRLDREEEKALGVDYLPLDQLLEVSDVVSLHTPLTPETRHLIGEEQLARMKKSAYLINTARGEVVDEKALIRHLEQGSLAGAGLDVFENEPHIPQELLEMDNVVMTPHIGTATHEVRLEMTREACQNIIDFFDGKMPASAINPQVFESLYHK